MDADIPMHAHGAVQVTRTFELCVTDGPRTSRTDWSTGSRLEDLGCWVLAARAESREPRGWCRCALRRGGGGAKGLQSMSMHASDEQHPTAGESRCWRGTEWDGGGCFAAGRSRAWLLCDALNQSPLPAEGKAHSASVCTGTAREGTWEAQPTTALQDAHKDAACGAKRGGGGLRWGFFFQTSIQIEGPFIIF